MRVKFYQTTLSNALARLDTVKKCFGSSGGYSQTRKSSKKTNNEEERTPDHKSAVDQQHKKTAL